MKKLFLLSIALTVIILVSSCSSSGSSRPDQVASTTRAPMITAAPTGSSTANGGQSGGNSQTAPDTAARLIVRNASIDMMVDDIATAVDRISSLAEQKKGFVVSSQVSPSAQGTVGSITVRIPAEEFGNTMKAIEAMAAQVKSQSTSSKDVTQEHTDLNSRLTNLQATEQQYLKILSQANTIQDILNVQRELSNTREQIDLVKGQIQYLQQTSATSLISVSLKQSRLAAMIVISQTMANVDEGIAFLPQVSGGFTPFSYQWSFGDKSTSTEANPTHSYGSSGTFLATLKVTDGRENTVTDKISIVISGGWNGGNVARSAWRALVGFFKVVANVLIWLGIFSPVWIIVAGLAVFFNWRSKKTRKRKPGTPADTSGGSPPSQGAGPA
jgi:hypothetical protein